MSRLNHRLGSRQVYSYAEKHVPPAGHLVHAGTQDGEAAGWSGADPDEGAEDEAPEEVDEKLYCYCREVLVRYSQCVRRSCWIMLSYSLDCLFWLWIC
jgi:hypothetical protein